MIRYFSLFSKEKCISLLFQTKYIEKKFNLLLFFLPNNAHDVDIFPDEKITKRSEPTNQAQTKINIVKGLQTYLNDLKNYLSTYHGFKICLVILKILGKY